MSRGFIKEGDQEEIPMVPPRAYLPKGMPNYVTQEGLKALNKEREDLENERVAVGGDYIMSNFIDAKMKLLINRINTAVEVDLSKANKEVVSFGAYVKYNGHVVRIVGVDEADVSKGLISFISPIAKALMGRKVGDVFDIRVPKGTETIEIQGIWYEKVPLTENGLEKDENPSYPATKTKSAYSKNNSTQMLQKTQKYSDVFRDTVLPDAVEDSNPAVQQEAVVNVFVPEENIMEFLPVVNERGNIVGRALHMELHKGNKIMHPVVHLHVINNKGVEVGKYWWHVTFGDAPDKTLKRKAEETLGLKAIHPKLRKQYVRETKTEKELVFVYTIFSDGNLMKTPKDKEYLDIFAKD